jgi:hypothetical protein
MIAYLFTPEEDSAESGAGGMTPSTVWHYTVGACIEQIRADRQLKLGWLSRRYPVLWFSANPVWEPSAAKKGDNGRRLNKEETALRYGGLYRISVVPTGLTPWNDWKRALKANPQSLIEFESYGDPLEWWCSFNAVQSSRWKSIERLTDDKWQAEATS